MSEHYYTQNPSSKVSEKEFEYPVRGKTIRLISVSGVFGFSSHVDSASKLLIEAFQPNGKKIVDLGCGFGPIGLSLKALFPDLDITMCDINNRAIEYTKRNALINHLEVDAIPSDLFSAIEGETFDTVVSNPPIAAGKKTLINLIDQAYNHLNPNGALWLVAYHNKGGSTLKKLMEQRFGNAQDMAKGGGIRVYRSLR